MAHRGLKITMPEGFESDYPNMSNKALCAKYGLEPRRCKQFADFFGLKKTKNQQIAEGKKTQLNGFKEASTGNLIKRTGNRTVHRMGI